MQDLPALKPFWVSHKRSLSSKCFCILELSIEVYIFEIQHIIEIGWLFRGNLGSFGGLGTGFMSVFDQSNGEIPELKHILNSLCKRIFAYSFFRASFGISWKALPNFALSILLETSFK